MVSAGLTSGLQKLHGLSERTGESAAINIREGRTSASILAANSAQGLRR